MGKTWTSHDLWCQSGTLLLETFITLMMLEYIQLTLRSRKVGKPSKPKLKVCAAVYFKANTIIRSFENNCMTGIALGMVVFLHESKHPCQYFDSDHSHHYTIINSQQKMCIYNIQLYNIKNTYSQLHPRIMTTNINLCYMFNYFHLHP